MDLATPERPDRLEQGRRANLIILSCVPQIRARTFSLPRLINHHYAKVALDPMIAGPEGGPSSDMQRYEG